MLEEPQQNTLLPMFINIAPLRYGTGYDSCEVELNFASAADLSGNTLRPRELCAKTQTDFAIVDGWIEKCTKDHKKCGMDSGGWYPSRLLYLRPRGPKARLVLSKDHPPKGHYITLSHRWGVESYTKLTSTTIQELQATIDIVSLPQIFQDTITIALHLGIYYLWIDTLCIKQDKDGRSDLRNELQDMEKIYSCAFLNVSATMSIDGSESLIMDRSPDPHYPSELELIANDTRQKFMIVDGDMWSDEIDNAPLNKRGWVFQERFMARRILHFGRHQMGWECCELAALEMFPNGLPRTSAMSFISKPKIETAMATLIQNPDRVDDTHFVELWQLLVHEYSKCTLTYSEDKLIAFSGIAKRMTRHRNDYYIAGMWKKSMVYDLGWWRPTEVRMALPIRLTPFRAPSWSWASVDGETLFPSTFGGVQAHFAEVEEVLEPIENDRSAPTTGILIRIRGLGLPLKVLWCEERITSFEVAGVRFCTGDSPRDSLISLEYPQEEVQELIQRGRLSFLPLFATSYLIHGAVLTKTRGVGTHRRLGAVEIPVMIESDFTTSMSMGEGSGQKEQWNLFQMDGPTRKLPGSTDQTTHVSSYWSRSAVKLLHLLYSAPTRRIIDIY
ncbi:uncharacterized protein Z518_07081 [Rhinocladiella mackenziei CBS 650.93]|uniref:Heterokaryon incompatibility domain-containing protein n=1 Tax=Rhinocladiella mackenziei CBS 650.93 TaxID=1442369 RepID=A0A0D2GZF1_9EURO|nr:uncharacterized protein Z518_07081 [Rhinocladiella mackenziei CBS 650.93]KIX03528.1 hypothetical protein Z518_07081 [Rhinocladiella mackenziei CBS 650.93]